MVWFVLVSIVGKVRGICIFNKICWWVELNVSVVFIVFGDICLMFRLVRWIRGGIVKIKVVIILEILLILNSIIIGIR